MQSNKKVWVALVVVAIIAIGGYFRPEAQQVVREILGANAGPTFFDPLEFSAGVSYRSSYATATPASMTLRVSDVQNFDTIVVSPTGAASAKTLTFFASSTAPGWLPRSGNMQKTCFLNATTTSGVTLVFAAGTGIDLQVATSTGSTGGAMDLTIPAGGTGCFDFIRASSTASTFDIQANLTEFSDGD